jgi:hypothetical protein
MTYTLSWHERCTDVRRRAARLTRPRSIRAAFPLPLHMSLATSPVPARLYRPFASGWRPLHLHSTSLAAFAAPRARAALSSGRRPLQGPHLPSTPDSGCWCRAARPRRLRSPRIGGPPLSPPPVPSRRQRATPGRLGFGGPPTTSPPDSGYLSASLCAATPAGH